MSLSTSFGRLGSTRYYRHCHVRTLQTTAARPDGKPRLYKDLKAPVPPPADHRRSWFFTVYRITNFAFIPFAAVYCVFFANFGDHEHVFSPARRWMDRHRREFFSLSSEELELAHADNKSTSGDSASRPHST
ncbi:hypothetical protein BC835DRAFT_1412758 [Cytidiella melzeri]|nr:hypothetical protein BC835DRAFT_1412758 [Cytidiella melzeri]